MLNDYQLIFSTQKHLVLKGSIGEVPLCPYCTGQRSVPSAQTPQPSAPGPALSLRMDTVSHSSHLSSLGTARILPPYVLLLNLSLLYFQHLKSALCNVIATSHMSY